MKAFIFFRCAMCDEEIVVILASNEKAAKKEFCAICRKATKKASKDEEFLEGFKISERQLKEGLLLISSNFRTDPLHWRFKARLSADIAACMKSGVMNRENMGYI